MCPWLSAGVCSWLCVVQSSDDVIARESMYINKSLSYLEQVVVALTTKSRAHVPYRQTKLTHVLKDSLGGNCRTVFIACVWCESRHMEETVSTLRLASRMMRVRNEASVGYAYACVCARARVCVCVCVCVL